MVKFKLNQTVRKHKLKLKHLLIIFPLVLTAAGILLISNQKTKNSKIEINNPNPQSAQIPKEPENISFDLAAVGDMLPHETITKAAKTDSGYNYLSLISPNLQESFKKSQLRFCNQEAPSAASLGVRGYPSFNAPAQFPKDLANFGCNLISTGNNHSSDAGQAGINGTLQEWDELQPLAVSGSNRSTEEQNKLQIFERDGVKFGFVAFTQDSNSAPPNSFSVNRLSNLSLVSNQITELRKQADVVIVSAHWGTEDSHIVNSLQKKYAQQLSDLGADIIIGSGPHVWQPYVKLNGSSGNETHVWYSIGNGLNSQTKADQLFSGVALLKITKLKGGKIQIDSPRVLPTYMHYVWENGIGFNNSQLLARTKLKWSVLSEPEIPNSISERNDFKTSKEEQLTKLKSYLANDAVQVLESY